MRYIFLITIAAVMFLFPRCKPVSGDAEVNQPKSSVQLPIDTPQYKQAVILDSNLVDQNVRRWKEANEKVRLKNCRYFISKRDGLWIEELSEEASADLCRCIDDAVSGMPTMNDDPLQIVVKGCIGPEYKMN